MSDIFIPRKNQPLQNHSFFIMFHTKIFLLFLTLVLVVAATNSPDILYEVPYFIRVYKDGRIERLSGTQFIRASIDPTTGVQSKDIDIAPNLNVSARLYLPNNTDQCHKFPLLVYFHGGGFLTGSAFNPQDHNFLNALADQAKVIVVSVNYRLAPEYLLPIGYGDSWLAVEWVFSHSKDHGKEAWLRNYVDYKRVYLGGCSAGGNIAHNMAIRAGLDKPGLVAFDAMFLNFPHFWGTKRIGDEESRPNRAALVESIWLHAYPNSTGFDDPASNPNMDPNLSKLGCKRVLIYVAQKDVLKDRGWFYAETLRRSGWDGDVSVVEVPGEDHAFNLEFPNTTNAKIMLLDEATFLKQGQVLRKSNSYTTSVHNI